MDQKLREAEREGADPLRIFTERTRSGEGFWSAAWAAKQAGAEGLEQHLRYQALTKAIEITSENPDERKKVIDFLVSNSCYDWAREIATDEESREDISYREQYARGVAEGNANLILSLPDRYHDREALLTIIRKEEPKDAIQLLGRMRRGAFRGDAETELEMAIANIRANQFPKQRLAPVAHAICDLAYGLKDDTEARKVLLSKDVQSTLDENNAFSVVMSLLCRSEFSAASDMLDLEQWSRQVGYTQSAVGYCLQNDDLPNAILFAKKSIRRGMSDKQVDEVIRRAVSVYGDDTLTQLDAPDIYSSGFSRVIEGWTSLDNIKKAREIYESDPKRYKATFVNALVAHGFFEEAIQVGNEEDWSTRSHVSFAYAGVGDYAKAKKFFANPFLKEGGADMLIAFDQAKNEGLATAWGAYEKTKPTLTNQVQTLLQIAKGRQFREQDLYIF